MNYHLVVVREVPNYARGQKITEPDEVARILASHHSHNVVRVPAPDQAVAATPVEARDA